MATVTKTIGTLTRDYSTITLWEADLDDGVIYASGDDAVGECYNDSAFDENVGINGGATIGLSTVTLKPAAGQRHNGTAGTGVRIVCSTNGKGINLTTTGSPLTLVDGIEVDKNGTTGHAFNMSRDTLDPYAKRVVGCIAHGMAGGTTTFLFSGSSDRPVYYANNIGYDVNTTESTGAEGGGIDARDNLSEIYSNTLYNIRRSDGHSGGELWGIWGHGSAEIKNNIVIDAIHGGGYANQCITASGLNIHHNITSDATSSGAGSIGNVTAAELFVSTAVGSEDLHLKVGCVAVGAGDSLSTSYERSYDVHGIDRNTLFGGQVWDIGAHQCRVVARIGSAGTDRDYSTFAAWAADLDDSTKYSSGCEAVGEAYNDSPFDEAVSLVDSGQVVGLGSIKLTVPESDRHLGAIGAGAKVQHSTGRTHRIDTQVVTYLEWLEFDYNSTNSILETNRNDNGGIYLENLIVHGLNGSATSRLVEPGYLSRTKVINCLVYDGTTDSTSSGASIRGIFSPNHAQSQVYNCTVHNIRTTGTASVSGIQSQSTDIGARNTTVTDAGSCFAGAFSVENNNISSDGSAAGTGSIINIPAADLYVSTTEGSEDFSLKSGAVAIDAGEDLSSVLTTDITGTTRSIFDIGAYEFAGVVPTEATVSFNTTADTNLTVQQNLNANITENFNLTVDETTTAIINASLSYGNSQGFVTTNGSILEGSFVVSFSTNDLNTANAIFTSEVSENNNLEAVGTTNVDFLVDTTENVNLSDAKSTTGIFHSAVAEAINAATIVNFGASVINVALLENSGFTQNTLTTAVNNVVVAESMNFTSFETTGSIFNAVLVENFIQNSTFSTTLVVEGVLSEALSASVLQSTLANYNSTVNETSRFTTTVDVNSILNVVFIDSVNSGSAFGSVATLEAALAENTQLQYQALASLVIEEALTESASLSDSYVAFVSIEALVNESLDLSEAVNVLATFNVGTSEDISLSTQLLKTAIMQAGYTDSTLVEIAVNGSSISGALITPDHRKLFVTLENRTLYVGVEDDIFNMGA